MLLSTALLFICMQPISGQNSNSSATSIPPRSSFKNYLEPEKSFEFTFDCSYSNKTICSIAQAEIEQVGTLIGNELLFTRRARVKVEFLEEVSPRKRIYARRPIRMVELNSRSTRSRLETWANAFLPNNFG